ncbi:LysM peptidoglycan-binding domain-containing protein [Pseudonocardia sp. HH130630-07]|uniref:LysM peptidoglycan-binding domain-containing protein n=1 Tax=Pseudonocardia sp. HH130630-07 TaxID=1690815 RepID=UPI000815033E|nr:transglycosylase family protein [Pseudonocardia sp. HH130630-07]ANY07126.1 transglycosylase [Pseudonocardia sp. HH130630-07]
MSQGLKGRRLLRAAAAGLVAVGATAAMAGTASAAPDGVWDQLAQCESGGDWSINTGNGYHGGLQFSPSTWRAYGGSGSAANASRSEQIAVAEKVLAAQGWNAWPSCSKKLGITGHSADTGKRVKASAPAQESAAPKKQSSGGGYTVRSGDTLGKIASAHGTSVSELASRNGIANVNAIGVGQVLQTG